MKKKAPQTHFKLYDTLNFGIYEGKTVYDVIHQQRGYRYILFVSKNTHYTFDENIIIYAEKQKKDQYKWDWLGQ